MEKAIEAIENIDSMILISLEEDKIVEFLNTLTQLEEEIVKIKKEAGKND